MNLRAEDYLKCCLEKSEPNKYEIEDFSELVTFKEAYNIIDEQAVGIQQIRNNLSNDNAMQYRVLHLMKVFLFPQDINFHHWCAEVKNSLWKTDKWQKTNKRLAKDAILQLIWESWEDSFLEILPGYISTLKENYVVPKFDELQLYTFVKLYHAWLAEKLSLQGYVTVNEVENRISELLERS